VLFAVGLLAGQLAPYGYGELNPDALSQAPSWAHPFGTDQTGRDYFSRVLYGMGTEAQVAILVTLFGTLVGTTIGVSAGYFAGRLGEALMRFTDLLLTLPALVTLLVAAAYLHTTTTFTVALLLSCLLWMPMARILRGACLSLREREYVEAARAVGASDPRIIVRHILPNAIGSITVAVSVMTANAIVLETTLSYLGFGIPIYSPNAPKPQASLGNVISDANVEGLFHWWGLFFPGLIVVAMIVSIYYVGDGLRDALDPTERRWVAPRRRRRDMQLPPE
jgi:glutathione transport system permease protein